MKYIIFLSLVFSSLSLIGCKEKRVDYFKYEIVDGINICALKTEEIKEASDFSMFDTSFKSINGNFNDELSKQIYERSLKNISQKESKHVFCFSKNSLKSDFLETQIRIELKSEKNFRQYEFINFFCFKNNNLINFKDREEAIKSCQ